MKDYRILTVQTTDSRVVSAVCPRCGETVELNPHPLYDAGFEEWGHAVSDLLERLLHNVTLTELSRMQVSEINAVLMTTAYDR